MLAKTTPPPRILSALEWLATEPTPEVCPNPAKAVYAAEILAERFSRAVCRNGRHAIKVQEVLRGGDLYATFLLEIGVQPNGLGMCLAVIPQPLLTHGRLTGKMYALGLPRRSRRFFDHSADAVEELLKEHAPAMVTAARASLSPEELLLLASDMH